MKKYFLLLPTFALALPLVAENVPAVPEKNQPANQVSGQPNHSQEGSSLEQNKLSGTQKNIGQNSSPAMPLNLAGLNGGDNSAVLSLLNPQQNLTDLGGKKIDETQQKLLRARFEKYLNAPEATSSDDLVYNQLLVDISQRLMGKGGGADDERIYDACKMLLEAEKYPMDDQLCRTIADKIINYWQTTRKISKLNQQNQQLEKDRDKKELFLRSVGNLDRQEFIKIMREKDATPPPSREHELEPAKKRLAETEAKIKENRSFEMTSRMNQKLDFQSLIVQFFIQRRYYHAMIANDFYRYIFTAEDGKIEGVDSLKNQVFGGVDIKLTTSTIDALSKEAINDVEKSVKAADFLISRGELHLGTQRLIEAFFIGENLAPVKTFPLERKREIMRYMRDSDKLLNAVKVKHVERAETILKEILSYVKDFDSGQIEAFIQTSKQLSDLSLQKAMVAAQSKNQQGVETSLQEAVEFWPTNPKIQEFLKTMIGRVDLKDMATIDFDRLAAQKDFRGIFNDRFRFAAALSTDGKRNGQFLEIMKRMEMIETSMGQARELSKLNNNFAAWELVEKVFRIYPEDQDLNRLRSELTVRASRFASVISSAESSAREGNKWVALMEYIRARQIYPMSSFANEEISKIAEEILSKDVK